MKDGVEAPVARALLASEVEHGMVSAADKAQAVTLGFPYTVQIWSLHNASSPWGLGSWGRQCWISAPPQKRAPVIISV